MTTGIGPRLKANVAMQLLVIIFVCVHFYIWGKEMIKSVIHLQRCHTFSFSLFEIRIWIFQVALLFLWVVHLFFKSIFFQKSKSEIRYFQFHNFCFDFFPTFESSRLALKTLKDPNCLKKSQTESHLMIGPYSVVWYVSTNQGRSAKVVWFFCILSTLMQEHLRTV